MEISFINRKKWKWSDEKEKSKINSQQESGGHPLKTNEPCLCCPLLCSKGIENFMNGNLMFQLWNGDGLQLPFSFLRWKLTKTLTKIGIKLNEWSHSVARIKNTKVLSAAPVREFKLRVSRAFEMEIFFFFFKWVLVHISVFQIVVSQPGILIEPWYW